MHVNVLKIDAPGFPWAGMGFWLGFAWMSGGKGSSDALRACLPLSRISLAGSFPVLWNVFQCVRRLETLFSQKHEISFRKVLFASGLHASQVGTLPGCSTDGFCNFADRSMRAGLLGLQVNRTRWLAVLKQSMEAGPSKRDVLEVTRFPQYTTESWAAWLVRTPSYLGS